MDYRSLSRELTLISLGLIKDNTEQYDFDSDDINFESVFESGIELMINHCREELAECEDNLEKTYRKIFESELSEIKNELFEKSRNEIKEIVSNIEIVMNTLSDILDFPKLIAISDHAEVRNDIKNRISKVLKNIFNIDSNIDNVMEGWRFKRLPRIDRDILRLAFVDMEYLNIPVSVACNEAVNLANKYSDKQGRKMINGILRRLQNEKHNKT
tara:strand:+ start:251 stop:892 length:642 start_codon:yes stop_codon:yes gene_type:complete